MNRLAATALALCLGCGPGKDSATPTTAPTGGSTTDSSPAGGVPAGTPGGTPTGTTTSTTTTPPEDFCPPWPAATGAVVNAGPADDLQATLDGLSPGDTLALASGTYTLTAPLVLSVDGVTVRSASGARSDVVLDGGGVAAAIFEVRASDVALVSLTLTGAWEDGVRVVPDTADVLGTTLYDLHVVDNAQFGVVIDANALNTAFADQGTIACSTVELTDAARANVRNGCRTGGIEAARAWGWHVRDTTARGFWCAAGSATAAIRFWKGSRDTVIERSRGENSRRGIVLGTGADAIVRAYADQPCGQGVLTQHYGGRVVNSLAWAEDPDLFASLAGVQDGIAVESACEVEVLHNTVHLGAGGTDGDLVHRYANTSGTVANNLVHGTVRRMDGSNAVSANNVENAPDTTWVHVPSGDFHLAPAATAGVDAGDPQFLSAVPEDIDGQGRAPAPDCGLDERP